MLRGMMLLGLLGAGAMAQSQGHLLVAQKGEQSLAIVDAGAGTVLGNVKESGFTGHEVVASPNGKFAYVPIYGDSGVGKPGTNGSVMDVIEVASQKVVNSYHFNHGVRPHCAVIGPDGLLYVTTELDQTVTVFDISNPRQPKKIGTIPTGSEQSHMLAISPDGARGYTANVGPGTVSVLDLKARKLLGVVKVAEHVQRIAVSRDGRWVFTSDAAQPRLAAIQTYGMLSDRANPNIKWISLPGLGYGGATTPDGKWFVLPIESEHQVVAIDIATMAIAHTIDVPELPQEVIIRPDGKFAYVSSSQAEQVAEIDLTSWKVTKTIKTGKGTDGLAWAK